MKYLFLIATIGLQCLTVFSLKLLDSFTLIIVIFTCCLVTGTAIRFSKTVKTPIVANIGWGLFYGSLASLILLIIFITWVSINLPK